MVLVEPGEEGWAGVVWRTVHRPIRSYFHEGVVVVAACQCVVGSGAPMKMMRTVGQMVAVGPRCVPSPSPY